MGNPIALNGQPNCTQWSSHYCSCWASQPRSMGTTILTKWFPIHRNSVPSQALGLPYIADRAAILQEHGISICKWAAHRNLMGNPTALFGYPTCSSLSVPASFHGNGHADQGLPISHNGIPSQALDHPRNTQDFPVYMQVSQIWSLGFPDHGTLQHLIDKSEQYSCTCIVLRLSYIHSKNSYMVYGI